MALLMLTLVFWLSADAPKVDWRMIFMLAVPLLIGGLVGLGLIATVLLKMIRRGETEFGVLFDRSIQADKFIERVNKIRSPKEEEFRTLIRDSIRDALREHDRESTAHYPIRHHFAEEINKLKGSR